MPSLCSAFTIVLVNSVEGHAITLLFKQSVQCFFKSVLTFFYTSHVSTKKIKKKESKSAVRCCM